MITLRTILCLSVLLLSGCGPKPFSEMSRKELEIEVFRYKCNVFLSSIDGRIYDPNKQRHLTVEEKNKIKSVCENRFGTFPNDKYIVHQEMIDQLKAKGLLSDQTITIDAPPQAK